MSRRRTWIAIGIGFASIVAGSLGWAAIGPSITNACDDPSLRVSDPAWSFTATHHGTFSAEGSVNGSALEWRRADGRPWTLLLFRWMNSNRGGFSQPGEPVTVRGTAAELFPLDSGLDTGPGYYVSWREGLLGCTWYDLRLSGEGVTEDDLIAVAATLH